MGCGPSDSAVALLFKDDPRPDVYVGMGTDPANAPVLPTPTAVALPALGSCERRHCRFHAAKGVHENRLSDRGQQAATSLAGAMELKLQPPGRPAWERAWRTCPCWATRSLCPVGGHSNPGLPPAGCTAS